MEFNLNTLDFCKEFKRMCASYEVCEDCPLNVYNDCDIKNMSEEQIKETIKIVEEWANQNPPKTRQTEFLKLFPKAYKENGIIAIKPCDIDVRIAQFGYDGVCKRLVDGDCTNCREKYWLEEIGE